MNQAQNAGQQPQQQIQVVEPKEVQIIKAQSAAQFALTPIGQQVKQFETQQRMAQMYSTSTIVPDTYRGNLGNCVIAIDMAMRMNANPLMIMQNLYIVHGNPSFSSKFLIATINASGRYSPRRYEWRGKEGSEERACRVCAYEAWDREHKEPIYGDWVSIKMAKAEGWYEKSGSKWKSMPDQMLRYRAAAFWQRVYCRGVRGHRRPDRSQLSAGDPRERQRQARLHRPDFRHPGSSCTPSEARAEAGASEACHPCRAASRRIPGTSVVYAVGRDEASRTIVRFEGERLRSLQ